MASTCMPKRFLHQRQDKRHFLCRSVRISTAEYAGGWTNASKFLWLSPMKCLSPVTSLLLYLSNWRLLCGWHSVLVICPTSRKAHILKTSLLTSYKPLSSTSTPESHWALSNCLLEILQRFSMSFSCRAELSSAYRGGPLYRLQINFHASS